MTTLTGNHGHLLKKSTAGGLVCLLLLAGLPLTVAAAGSCKGWKTAKFFESAAVKEVTACLSAGEDPNQPDAQGLTALHRAARDTGDPAVIEALLDAGANPRAYSIAGRLPWYFARKNDKIKGSDAYQRLRVASAKKPKKADWSRVQAVPHNTKTAVWLYKDEAPTRRIRGRFDSATADAITLVLKDGQTRTVQKQAVRKVLVYRPFDKRWQGWATLAGSVLAAELFRRRVQDLKASFAALNLSIAAGAAVVVFLNSGMRPIYNAPPKHRPLPLPSYSKSTPLLPGVNRVQFRGC